MSVDAMFVTAVELHYRKIKIILRMWLDNDEFYWTYELQGHVTGSGGVYIDSGTAVKTAIESIDRMEAKEEERMNNVSD